MNIKDLGPLLDSKWKPDVFREDMVCGTWAEDGTAYKITCPPQLRQLLISLQDSLYEKYKKYNEVVAKKEQLEQDCF
jgi:hypothetical protein